MKKILSKILAFTFLATVFTFGGTMPAGAAVPALPTSYQFVDVCYSPQLNVYVAMAKDANYDATQLYTSNNLYDWSLSYTPAYSGKNSAKADVTQVLGWWSDKNLFVAAVGAKLYASPDGYQWTLYDGIGIANLVLEINNGKLVVAGGATVKVFSNLSNPIADTDYETFVVTSGYYIKALGVSNADASTGNITYEMIDQYVTWSKTGTNDVSTAYPNIDAHPLGISYSENMNKWAVVNNTTKLRFLTASAAYTAIDPVKLSDGTDNADTLTSVFDNGEDILVGTSTGKIYSLTDTGTVPAADAVWNIAAAGDDTAANSDKVVSMCAIGGGRILAATTANLYVLTKTGSGYSYTRADYQVGVTKVALKQDIFSGVALNSVAYSPRLDLYVAVGKDVTAASNATGRIYTSKDGLSWQQTNVGNSNIVVDMSKNAGHGVIWWDAAQCFLVQATNALVYSKDGYTWKWTSGFATNGGGAFTVARDTLYEATFGTRKVKAYTCLDAETFPASGSYSVVTYTPSSNTVDYWNKIAVDNEAVPTIFTTYAYFGAIVGPNVTGYTDPTISWKRYSSYYAAATAADIVYSAALDKFIAVNTDKEAVVIISKDGTTAKGPNNTGFASSDTVKPNALATNGSKLLLGSKVGEFYITADSSSFSTAVWTKVNCLDTQANSYKVQSICTGKDGNFVAVASAGSTNGSEIMYIKSDGSGYQKASEATNVTEIKAGDTFNIALTTVNTGISVRNAKAIAAVYSADKKLVQLVMQPITISAGTNKVTIPFTAADGVTSDAHMKIMVWSGLDYMQPMNGASDFFSR